MGQIHKKWIGSKLVLREDEIKKIVENVHSVMLHKIKHADSYIDAHNAFTAYTVMLLFNATGHRPVVDPFCFKIHYDLNIGMMLIDDKAVSERHRYRMVTLPSLAIEQLKEYEKHLKWLLCHLIDEKILINPKYAVHQLFNKDLPIKKQQLPLLFFLKKANSSIETHSVRLSSLKQHIDKVWPVPYNASRHIIATRLRQKSSTDLTNTLAVEAIETHLGHMQGIQHPFGATSVTSPAAYQEQINPSLNELLLTHNWSIIRAKQQYRSISNIKPHTWTHKTKDLGPVERENWRKEQKQNDNDVVEKAFLTYTQKSPLTDKEKALKVLDIIIQKSDNDKARIRNRLTIYWKKLLNTKKHKPNFKLPGRPHVIETEVSPFSSNTLLAYDAAKQARQSFINYLQDQGKKYFSSKNNTISYYRRLAELVISAALFDHISSSQILNALSESNLVLRQEKRTTYIDIYEPIAQKKYKNLIWRWLPHALSISLVHGINNEHILKSRPKSINKDKLHGELVKILTLLGLHVINKNEVIRYIAKLSNNYWIIHSPPFLRDISNGNTPVKPIPETALVRLARDERLVEQEKTKKDIKTDLLHKKTIYYAKSVNSKSHKLNNVKHYRSDLTNDIKQAEALLSKGRKSRNNIQKEELEKRIRSRFVKGHKYPSIAVAIGSWCLKLCTTGTDLYGPIKFSTIKNYTNMIANALFELTYAQNFFRLDPEHYDYYYDVALKLNKTNDKVKFINNLADFHNFLSRAELAPELDWCVLKKMANRDGMPSSVSANIITLSEYILAIKLTKQLSNDGECNKRRAMQYCSLLICGYRFGLRITEALHLQHRNIQHNQDWSFIVLSIANTYLGDTKSAAGRRQIPLVEKLSQEEKTILRTVFATPVANHKDESAIIYSTDHDSHTLINEVKASQILQSSLKRVTGDPTAHYHLLRHSFNSRIYPKLFNIFITNLSASDTTITNNLIQLLTGHEHLSSHVLKALSVISGHSQVTTTFINYIHTADQHLHYISGDQKHWKKIAVDRVSFIIAYATGTPIGNIEREQSRKKINPKDLLASLIHANSKYSIKASKVKTLPPPTDESLSMNTTYSPQEITLIDIDKTLLLFCEQTDKNPIAIAESLFLDIGEVKNIIEAFQIQKKTSYYLGYQSNNENYKDTSNVDMHTPAETDSLQKIFKYIFNILTTADTINLHTIEQGIDAWSNSYYPKTRYKPLIFDQSTDLYSFLETMELFGLTTCSMRLSVSTHGTKWYKYEPSTNNEKTNPTLTLGNIKYSFYSGTISQSIPLPPSKARINTKERLSIILDKKAKHAFYVQKRLDRTCFLVSIWLQAKKIKTVK